MRKRHCTMVTANYGHIRELAVWSRTHHSHSLTTPCPNMVMEVDTLYTPSWLSRNGTVGPARVPCNTGWYSATCVPTHTYTYTYSSLSTLHVPVQAHVMCTLAILEGERLPLALSSSLKCFTYTRENRGGPIA